MLGGATPVASLNLSLFPFVALPPLDFASCALDCGVVVPTLKLGSIPGYSCTFFLGLLPCPTPDFVFPAGERATFEGAVFEPAAGVDRFATDERPAFALDVGALVLETVGV